MAQDAHKQRLEDLLAEAGWVTSIARRLVGDFHVAEDLAQDTWVAALEDRASTRPESLRSWLAGVGRNLSRRRGQREAQRRAVERSAARVEATEDEAGVTERLELQKRLADAILTLDEPYRAAVVLRYLDGLAPEALAERLGISNANARQRVSRGVAMLRARLDRDLGARALWAVPLARLAEQGPGTGALTTTAVAGGAIMGAKVLVGGVLAAAALVGVWVVNRPPVEVRGDSRDLATPLEVAAPEIPATTNAGADLGAPAAVIEGRRAATTEAVGARAPELVLEGQAIDVEGRSLAGLSVAPCTATGDPVEEERAGSSSIATDEEGLFRVTSQDGVLPTHVRLESEWYLPRVVEVPETSPWEVVLLARPVIEGRVFDPAGAPVSPPGWISIAVDATGIEEHGEHKAQLLADGTYRVSGLPVGRWSVTWTRARGFPENLVRADQELLAGAVYTHDLILEPGLVVHGVVLEEESRKPVPFARVWGDVQDYESDPYAPSTTADARGRFRLLGFKLAPIVNGEPGDNVFFLAAASAEHGSSPLNFLMLPPDERGEYEVELLVSSRLCTLTARVFEPDGTTPATGVSLFGGDALDQFATGTTDADGMVTLEGLAEGPFDCSIYRPDRGPSGLHAAWAGSIELDHHGVNEQRIVLQADAGTAMAGRVVDAGGAPVPGIEVRAAYMVFAGSLAFEMRAETATTDSEGHYRFEGMRTGRHEVSAEGCSSPSRHSLELTTGELSSADFVARACMTVTGWVELGDTPAAELEVQLHASTGRRIASVDLSADGSFEISDVSAEAGEVELLRNREPIDRAPVDPASPTGIVLRVP